MKILLISDSHGKKTIRELIEYENADLNLHLGDSEFSPMDYEMQKFDYAVRGNCDYYNLARQEIVIDDINNISILMVHGDIFNGNLSLLSLSSYAQKFNTNIICYGHTHIPMCKVFDDILILNPGSFAKSRSNQYPNSYMVLNTKSNNDIDVTLKNADTLEVIEQINLLF